MLLSVRVSFILISVARCADGSLTVRTDNTIEYSRSLRHNLPRQSLATIIYVAALARSCLRSLVRRGRFDCGPASCGGGRLRVERFGSVFAVDPLKLFMETPDRPDAWS
eukprot:6038763-Pyramimonas_sp.AAC.1